MSSDARQASEPTDILRPISKKRKADAAGRRIDGMQRELYSLLGNNTPPLAITDNRFRSKPNWKQKAVPWKWAAFTNRARHEGDDKLVLHHWVRVDETNTNEDYQFAKYNTRINVPIFSEESYEEALKTDSWSYEETKYLFELATRYDLRWLVIHDRYDFNPLQSSEGEDVEMQESSDKPDRSLEDLKERYYDVCTRLMLFRQKKGDGLSPAEEDLVKQMKYSKENELKRKAHLERLLSRSPAEIAEEEALVIESRKLEAAAERMLLERQEVLRLLDAPQPTGPISQFQSSQGLAQLTTTLLTSDRVKKKNNKDVASATASSTAPATVAVKAEPSNTAASSASATPKVGSGSGSTPVPTHKQSSASAAPKKPSALSGAAAVQSLIQRKLSVKEEAAFGLSYHDKLSPGVYLRSTKITTYKPALQSKVAAILQELELPNRPVMPTAKVCAKMESLLQSITVLLQAKKQLDELETELKIKQDASGNPQ